MLSPVLAAARLQVETGGVLNKSIQEVIAGIPPAPRPKTVKAVTNSKVIAPLH
jgi:hypothetical protein